MVRDVEVRRSAGAFLMCLGLALVSAGCAGKSKGHGDDSESSGAGATGGTAGTSATGVGGTGGPSDAPQPAAMGVSLMLRPPSSASVSNLGGRSCNAGTSGAFTYVIGSPPPGKTIEDGTQGATVSCSVMANGEFSLTGGGVDQNGRQPVAFSFIGTIVNRTDVSQNVGAMTFFSPDTGHLNTLAEFPLCTFGPVTTLKPGAILTDFDCPLIGSPDDSTSGCAVHGTLAFEYCDISLPTQ
jgi:hypothetical protein